MRRRRVIIERVSPEVDLGRFPAKRIVGDLVRVEADIFADGHDLLRAVVLFREGRGEDWREAPMRLEAAGADRWAGTFSVTSVGSWFFTAAAWVDSFGSWRRDLEKKFQAAQDVAVELRAGAALVAEAAAGAPEEARQELEAISGGWWRDPYQHRAEGLEAPARVEMALDARLLEWMASYAPRRNLTRYGKELAITADPELARFGAWYEIFPRSCGARPGQHGTLKDLALALPRIASMGFDIVYLPPIHPIGSSFRKGPNNTPEAGPEDPGSPWAIGSEDGGHKAIHPRLGTMEDFRALIERAGQLGLRIALDAAFQCSPDHPYVREHPEWFRKRPDGTIQYAENPPKKYQDIYPLDFETDDWRALWAELKSIFEFWIGEGVSIFRVDNPHTKSFYFWEWCLTELKREHPELIFLSEAFTRPRLMYYLAKLGFSQSYNYFPWRNTKEELTAYFTELTQSPVRDYFRSNLWPNTPDILTEYLQFGGRPAFMARLVLAATLGASYGIYGPPFELCETRPRSPGSEEYLDSEKYQIRSWELGTAGGLMAFIARVNRIRRDNPALHADDTLEFHEVNDGHLLAYSKTSRDGENVLLMVVNLDPHHKHSGLVKLNLGKLGLTAGRAIQAHELLTESRFIWNGSSNYVELDPRFLPALILRVSRHIRTEKDFDYFL